MRDYKNIACLYGLIRAVEKESGKITTLTASVTSFIVIGLAGLIGKHVSGL